MTESAASTARTWTALDATPACPACGDPAHPPTAPDPVWRCGACSTSYLTWSNEAPDKSGEARAWVILDVAFVEAYQIEVHLGMGGSGRVYRARDRASGRTVAVKFLTADLADGTGRARFEREGKLLASVRHPSVVEHLGQGTLAQGVPYLVSVFVAGGTLRDRLRGSRSELIGAVATTGAAPREPLVARRVPARDAIELMLQVLSGLSALHTAGIVHRDLKPENILLDESGRVLVADLGLARTAVPHETLLTQTGAILGTPFYIAPELVRGGTATVASDLYSAGVMLHELLCGTTPFGGSSVFEVLRRHVDEVPESLVDRVPGLPAELDRIVSRTLAKEPAGRPSSAAALSLELAAVRARLLRRSRSRRLALAGAVVAIAFGTYRLAAHLTPEPPGLRLARQARALYDSGRFANSLPLTTAALEAVQRDGPRDSHELGDLWLLSGRTHLRMGQPERARRDLSAAQETFQRAFGVDSLETAQVLLDLGHVEMAAAQPRRAALLYDGALARRRRLLHRAHWLVADAMDNLAKARVQLGDVTAGLELLRESLAIWEQCPPMANMSGLPCLSMLAWIAAEHGDLATALTHNRRAIELARQILAPDHTDIAALMGNMAAVYKRDGKVAESLPLFAEALAVLDRGRNRRTVIGAQLLNNLADSHLRMGAAEKAEPLLTEAIDIYRNIYPSGHPLLAQSLFNLVRGRRERGRAVSSSALLVEAETMQARGLPPASRELERTRCLLARTLLEEGRFADAERVLTALVGVPDAALTPANRGLPEDLVDLSALLARAGHRHRARELCARALAIATRLYPPGAAPRERARAAVTLLEADR